MSVWEQVVISRSCNNATEHVMEYWRGGERVTRDHLPGTCNLQPIRYEKLCWRACRPPPLTFLILFIVIILIYQTVVGFFYQYIASKGWLTNISCEALPEVWSPSYLYINESSWFQTFLIIAKTELFFNHFQDGGRFLLYLLKKHLY